MATLSLNLHMDFTQENHRLLLWEPIRGRPVARRMGPSIRHNGNTVQLSRKAPLRVSRRGVIMTTAMLSPNLGMDSIQVHHRVPVWTSTCGRLTAGRMAMAMTISTLTSGSNIRFPVSQPRAMRISIGANGTCMDQSGGLKAAQALAMARGAAGDRDLDARGDSVTRSAPIDRDRGPRRRQRRSLLVCAWPYGLRGGWGSRVCATATDRTLIAAEGRKDSTL
jgi:hypothetical protein